MPITRNISFLSVKWKNPCFFLFHSLFSFNSIQLTATNHGGNTPTEKKQLCTNKGKIQFQSIAIMANESQRIHIGSFFSKLLWRWHMHTHALNAVLEQRKKKNNNYVRIGFTTQDSGVDTKISQYWNFQCSTISLADIKSRINHSWDNARMKELF